MPEEEKADFEEFSRDIRAAIDQSLTFAGDQDEPAVVALVIGTSKIERGATGRNPAAVANVAHNISIQGIASALLSIMVEAPETPFAQALALILENAEALKNNPHLGKHSHDDDDELGFKDNILEL